MFVIGGDGGGGQLADILFDSYSVFLWPNCSQTPRPAWYLGLSLQWKNTVSARSVTTVSCLGDYCRNTIMIVHVKSLPTHHHYGIIYYNGSLVRLWHHHCHQFIVCRRFPLFWIKCTSSSNDSLCSFTVIWAITVCSKQLASHSSHDVGDCLFPVMKENWMCSRWETAEWCSQLISSKWVLHDCLHSPQGPVWFLKFITKKLFSWWFWCKHATHCGMYD